MSYKLRIAYAFVSLVVAGCVSSRPPESIYAGKAESVLRSELGVPHREFSGHYGNPPLEFTRRFTGEIKTLVFKRPGGEVYVSLEKRPTGWISISSSWLPDGAVF